MKRGILILCLATIACGPPKAEVIKNVCDPANEENAPSIESLAAKQGYDLKRTQDICRDHLQAFLRGFAKNQKDAFGEKSPYDN